jgi:hypothetical protein
LDWAVFDLAFMAQAATSELRTSSALLAPCGFLIAQQRAAMESPAYGAAGSIAMPWNIHVVPMQPKMW